MGFTMHSALNKKLNMTIKLLGRENVCKKLGDFEKLRYLGKYLSSKIQENTRCGMLTKVNELSKEELFVKITLEEP